MRGLAVFLAVTLAASGVAKAQLVKDYGGAGAWNVLLEKDSHGDEFCLASSRQAPEGPAAYNLSFAVDSNYNRVFLGYQGAALPTPRTVRLSVDGKTVADLTVNYPQANFAGNLHLIVIDLPPNLLSALVFPAMAGDDFVTADAGAARFSVPTAHFGAILNQVESCAVRERRDDGN